MPAIDPTALVTDIRNAATAVIGKDVSTVGGFASSQVQDIAQQAVFIAEGVADGSIKGDTQKYFLGQLEEMTRSFVNILAGLVAVAIEELWNAVVGVVWGAINKATGMNFVVP